MIFSSRLIVSFDDVPTRLDKKDKCSSIWYFHRICKLGLRKRKGFAELTPDQTLFSKDHVSQDLTYQPQILLRSRSKRMRLNLWTCQRVVRCWRHPKLLLQPRSEISSLRSFLHLKRMKLKWWSAICHIVISSTKSLTPWALQMIVF